MTAADVAERVEICRNVEATLAKAQFAVPGSVSVYPFGSSVNGLGFRWDLLCVLGCASACRERFFGKYSMSYELCFGSRYIGRLAGS